MGRTTDLRRELKWRFYSFAVEHGFKIDMTDGPFSVDFRRVRSDSIDVFDLQWEKYGRPRFVVNFGQCPATGAVHFNAHIPPEKVLPYMGTASGRLQPNTGGASTRRWFCQDHAFFRRILLRQQDRPASEVVDLLLSLFPELEDWFQSGRLGPHMSIINYPWRDQKPIVPL